MSNQASTPAILWQRAEAAAARRDWDAAAATFRDLLALSPENPKVLVQLSYVESLAGRYRSARDFILRACLANPKDPETASELVSRLRTFNEAGAIKSFVARLRPWDKVSIPLLIACAGQLSNLGDQEAALELLDEAARGDADYPPTQLARGQVLTFLGRFDEAERSLAQCQRRAPEIANTYWWRSRLRRQTKENNHVAAIRGQLSRPGRKPADVAMLSYALHKELDDLGDYDAAWRALESACTAKRSTLGYRKRETTELVDALMALRTDPERASQANEARRVPIFIVGMHRSGTTLLEHMLDGHNQVRGVGELYDFTSQMRHATDYHCRGVIDATLVSRAKAIDYAAVGAAYLEGMEWRLGEERYFTDKLPSNFLNLGFICQALPHARILHLVRDPVETCFSNLRELFSDACPYSYDQDELAHYYLEYERLMAHWHRAFPGRVLDVDYALLTRDPQSVLPVVSGFCGLEFQPAMLATEQRSRGVATASAVQVRSKVEARDTPKWMPYREHLRTLREALAQSPARPRLATDDHRMNQTTR